MEIVRTITYLKALKKLGASDSDIRVLERQVATNPEIGDVIPGLRGVRKIRFGMAGRGKRGGGRAIYYVIWRNEVVLMITAYAKTEKEDLAAEDKKAILRLLEELEQ